MNIAPYALIQALDWRLEDSTAAEVMRELVGQYVETAQLLQSVGLLRESPLVDGLSDSQFPVGLYTMDYFGWSKVNKNAVGAESHDVRPQLFLTALQVKDPGVVLLFPDDSTDQPNFAVFAPVKAGTGVYALNHLRFWLEPASDRIESVDTAGDGKCALLIKQSLDSREIDCSRTGCRGPCRFLTWLERGRYETYGCRCDIG